jgi:hypothetical protein
MCLARIAAVIDRDGREPEAVVIRDYLCTRKITLAVGYVCYVVLLLMLLDSLLDQDGAGLAFSLAIASLWGILLSRIWMSRIVVSESGLVLVGVLRSATVVWEDFVDIRAQLSIGGFINYVICSDGRRHMIPYVLQRTSARHCAEFRRIILEAVASVSRPAKSAES